jgi:hypothetical protein
MALGARTTDCSWYGRRFIYPVALTVSGKKRREWDRGVLFLRPERLNHAHCDLVFYVLAVIFALAVPGALGVIFWHQFSATWLTELPKYQALVAGFTALFTAGLASIGVALTIDNQKQIANRQLEARQREEELARGRKRQQIASAFIGEIEVALDELRHERLKPVLEKALEDLSSEPPHLTGLVTIGHFGRYYSSAPDNVGLFADAVSEGLTRFYATLEAVRANLDWFFSSVAEKQHSMNPPAMIYLIKDVIHNIDSCLKTGPILVDKLKTVRDAEP